MVLGVVRLAEDKNLGTTALGDSHAAAPFRRQDCSIYIHQIIDG